MAKSRKEIQKAYRQRRVKSQDTSVQIKGRPRKDDKVVKSASQRVKESRQRKKAHLAQLAAIKSPQQYSQLNISSTDTEMVYGK